MDSVTENGSEPLGLIWIDTPDPVAAVGLVRILENEAKVHVGREAPAAEDPSFVVLGASDAEDLSDGLRRVRAAKPDAPILVFGLHLDLSLARDALRMGTRGYIHAGMKPEQVLRAVKVASGGEIVAPRRLLEFLVDDEGRSDLNALSHRQREILGFVAEGLSNAQIAKKLFLTESTVKQHLRAAYKLLGVRNRTEAARLVRENPKGGK